MTPIFIKGGASLFGVQPLGCPEWLSLRLLRLLIGRFLSGLFTFLFRRFRRLSELHGAREQSGKETATHEIIAEQLPRFHPYGKSIMSRPLGQRDQPAHQVFRVFGAVKRIKE